MIYVTQGYEKSISREVFEKAFSCLSPFHARQFTFIAHQNNLPHLDHLQHCSFSHETFQTSRALEIALDKITSEDILLTLPSIKSEFIFEGQACSGHTEYLRKYFKTQSLAMCFESENCNILLLTDHLPLREVCLQLKHEFIFEKLKHLIPFYDSFIFSGINPHAGEGGLLGHEDQIISSLVKTLSSYFPNKYFKGPLSGDSLHRFIKPKSLLVYTYHDQGLSMFKAISKNFSINRTYGLPFTRISLDHGTACDIYNKNKANYLPCLYALKQAINLHQEL